MLSKLWPIFKHCCLGKEKLKNCEACESGIQECICSSKLQDVPPRVPTQIGCGMSILWLPIGFLRVNNFSGENTQTVLKVTGVNGESLETAQIFLDPNTTLQASIRSEIGDQDIKSVEVLQHCQYRCIDCLSDTPILLYTSQASPPLQTFNIGCAVTAEVNAEGQIPTVKLVNTSPCVVSVLLESVQLNGEVIPFLAVLPLTSTILIFFPSSPITITSILVTSGELDGVPLTDKIVGTVSTPTSLFKA